MSRYLDVAVSGWCRAGLVSGRPFRLGGPHLPGLVSCVRLEATWPRPGGPDRAPVRRWHRLVRATPRRSPVRAERGRPGRPCGDDRPGRGTGGPASDAAACGWAVATVSNWSASTPLPAARAFACPG